jgi:hypothetical protein
MAIHKLWWVYKIKSIVRHRQEPSGMLPPGSVEDRGVALDPLGYLMHRRSASWDYRRLTAGSGKLTQPTECYLFDLFWALTALRPGGATF